jgi:AcrR family transcriptional regulator
MVEPAGAGRREQIIAVSAELFAERGAAATSMRDIGRASGILGGSLHHNFASMDEIIDTLTRRGVGDLSGW